MYDSFPVEQDFCITSFHSAIDFYWDEKYSYAGEQHDFWEVVYVLSGVVESVEDDRIYLLHSGDMLLHAPMEFHKIRSSSGTRPHLFVLSFSAKGDLPQSLRDGVFRLNEEQRALYEKCFFGIHDFCFGKKDGTLGLFHTLCLSSLLLSLSQGQHSTAQSSLSSAKEYRRAVCVMKAQVCNNVTLSLIAKECHISVSYMKDIFLQYAGISPKKYYNMLRYDEAARRLREGCSATEVSEHMGFSSPSYFSVFMKQRAGLPPTKYAKSQQK